MIEFTKSQITKAIRRALPGIQQYLDLMERFSKVDVSANRQFQRHYNHFYRVRQKPAGWYESYFGVMQAYRSRAPSFGEVLDKLHEELGTCEASFASKLVATLDVNNPIWDSFVLKNLGIAKLIAGSPERFETAKVNYLRIQKWYKNTLSSEHGWRAVKIFDELVPEHHEISALKKIDFVLWQTRSDVNELATVLP